jgi:predicted NUDIX family phosphoesterase
MEFVYVLKRDELLGNGAPFSGFVPLAPEALERRFLGPIRNLGFFLERERAEKDPTFKQIIPYTVVTDGTNLFAFRRGTRQTEARLRRKLSIGIGGHVNPVDGRPDPVERGCRREIAEELVLEGPGALEPLGVLNDDSNEVGAVHFGVVYRLRAAARGVRVRETATMEGGFEPLEALRSRARSGENFESWSAILLEAADDFLPTSKDAGRILA